MKKTDEGKDGKKGEKKADKKDENPKKDGNAKKDVHKQLPEGVHSRVFMDICVGGKEGTCGRVTMDLNKSTPKTSENFRALCTGEKGQGQAGKPLNYAGATFHRIIPGFMAQGGDFT